MTRLILFCDFERPLHAPMAALNRWMIRHVMKATGSPNEIGEPVGAVNRLYGRISELISEGRALKARSRPLYEVLRAGAILALLAVFLAPWPY
jgi:beta-hydroxylase